MSDHFTEWENLYPGSRRPPSLTLYHNRGVAVCDPGIDIRETFNNLLLTWGNWVVLRKMKIGQYSKYYDPLWKEAVGGSKWEFQDIATRVRTSDVRKTVILEGEHIWPQGTIPDNYLLFYFSHDVGITTEDIIFYTIDPTIKPINPSPPYADRWDVKSVQPMRGVGGRIEFYSVLGFKSAIKE